ncbi:MAG: ABC transporter permease [Vicinamibacterales bacterium]
MRPARGLLRLGSLILCVAAWEALARWDRGLLFPSFTETATSLVKLIDDPMLWRALWLSHQALLIGFGSAAVLGVATGLLIGRWPAADALVDPYLTLFLVTPMSAVIPVVVITVGAGLEARALVVLLFAVVVIAVNTRTGIHTVDPAWLELGRTFGASELQLWRTIVLPGALPSIISGLRLGLGRAFSGMVAVELLLVAVGVGRLILDFQGRFDGGAVYGTVIVLTVEAVALLRTLAGLQRRFAPWADRIEVE